MLWEKCAWEAGNLSFRGVQSLRSGREGCPELGVMTIKLYTDLGLHRGRHPKPPHCSRVTCVFSRYSNLLAQLVPAFSSHF